MSAITGGVDISDHISTEGTTAQHAANRKTITKNLCFLCLKLANAQLIWADASLANICAAVVRLDDKYFRQLEENAIFAGGVCPSNVLL